MKETFSIQLKDSFLSPRQELGRRVTIPASLERCRETGRLAAFKLQWKQGDPDMPHIYWDSDVAKVLEGMALASALFHDKEMEAKLDELVALVISAQQPDGYLNTHFTAVEPEKRWKNLFDWHELYCAGHLIEAAVARFNSSGKRDFLDAMCHYADLIWKEFGPDGRKGYPGHEELELALVKLYRVTGEKKYLELARLFVDRRGTSPNYFKSEDSPDIAWRDLENRQAHCPVREQKEATGHAVRAVYLYSGMADVAYETGDAGLMNVCERLFNDLTTRKMFITGGIGCRLPGESIGSAFELPQNRAYAESCASMGLVFFASRMLKYTGKVCYADVIERLICNGAISGLSLSGDEFFYANPVSCDAEFRTIAHLFRTRQKWHDTSCCPTNYCRFLPQLGSFCYRLNQSGLVADIAVSAELKTDDWQISVESGWPYDGKAVFRCICGQTRLCVRIPDWCGNEFTADKTGTVSGRYWSMDGFLKEGETLQMDFKMSAELLYPDTRIPSLRGMAAIRRGPVLYCVESTDCTGYTPCMIRMPAKPEFSLTPVSGLPEGTVALKFSAYAIQLGKKLYSAVPPEEKEIPVTAVPYALWQNRGPAEMEMFFPVK